MLEREAIYKQAAIPRSPGSMPHVQVAPGGRYFMTEDGKPFLAIGHNDAMPWVTLHSLHREENTGKVEAYIKMLVEHGVTVLRIMLEYSENPDWFFEDREGRPVPDSVLYWDDLIGLCERYGLRLLVQFWDTFFMSRRWDQHPYSAPGSGFDGPGSFCTSPTAMEAEKRRIRFFINRWGNSPAIFAYDLLNEIHPYWGGTPEEQSVWVAEIAQFTRQYEMERWGKRHLMTVSLFGAKPDPGYSNLIWRHPDLDFASTHVYELGLVDDPDNTIDCALVMRDAVRLAFSEITDIRPYTDSESGPIHLFMDLQLQLTEPFEAEYYHNMSWAHLATGGAGSGLRWPFRDPHCLTQGMHEVQRGMSQVVRSTALNWLQFSPRPFEETLRVENHAGSVGSVQEPPLPVLPFGCSDGRQALVWLLRDSRSVSNEWSGAMHIAIRPPGSPAELETPASIESFPATAHARAISVAPADLLMPPLQPGHYVAEFWETYSGEKTGELHFPVDEAASTPDAQSHIRLSLPSFGSDLAITISPAHDRVS